MDSLVVASMLATLVLDSVQTVKVELPVVWAVDSATSMVVWVDVVEVDVVGKYLVLA